MDVTDPPPRPAVKMMPIADLFGVSAEELAAHLEGDGFLGNLVLHAVLTNKLCAEASSRPLSAEHMHRYCQRYESRHMLTLFMLCGTDFPACVPAAAPDGSDLQPQLSYKTIAGVFEALLWMAVKDRRKSLCDRHLKRWAAVVDQYLRWVDQHINLALWDEQMLSGHWQQAEGTRVSQADAQQLMALVAKQTTSAPSAADSSTSSSLPVNSALAVHKPSAEAAAVLTEVALDSHCWSAYGGQHHDVCGRLTAASWHGSQCAHCQAMLVRRKVSQSKVIHYLLGMQACPGDGGSWLAGYRELLAEAAPLLGRGICSEDLQQWGLLGDGQQPEDTYGIRDRMFCTFCKSPLVCRERKQCTKRFRCRLPGCSNQYPCHKTTRRMHCAACNVESVESSEHMEVEVLQFG